MSCRKNFDRQMSKSGCCNNSKDVDYSGDVLLVNKIMLLTKKIRFFFFFLVVVEIMPFPLYVLE